MLTEIFRQLMTESDNRTHDLYRYLALLSIVVGLGLNVFVVVKGNPFNMQDFGIGVGALFAGVGVALSLKKETSNASKI